MSRSRHLISTLVTGVLASLLVSCGGIGEPTSSDSASVDAPWPERPNVLWIVAEDLSPVIPPFGDVTVETPTLTRLANEGVRYTHVFSPSGVCAPSRAALATGLYPVQLHAQHMRTGPWATPRHVEVAGPSRIPELPYYEAVPPTAVRMHSEILRRAGYYTTNNAKDDYQFRKPVTAWDDSSQTAHWRGRAPDQPFFSIFNLGVTHESQVWARADQPLLLAQDAEVPVPPYLPRTDVALRDVRRMYSNVVEMDRQAGELLRELEEDGLLEETIVVWYSDHGGPLPRQKRLLYDSGLRAPMIIRYPGRWRAGETDDQLISFVDFKPTLLSMAGLEPPDYVAGRVFVGPGGTTPRRRYVHAAADRFDEAYDSSRAVRDQRFKYIRHLDTERAYYLPLAYREQMPIMQELLRLRDAGELDASQSLWFRAQRPAEELFDTEADPHEVNDLASDPEYSDKLAELRAECDRWMQEVGDPGRERAPDLESELELVASIWPDLEQPVTAAPAPTWSNDGLVLESATPGASIGYQILGDDPEPGSTWSVYDAPLQPSAGRVVAVAHRLGYLPSETIEMNNDPAQTTSVEDEP